MIKAQAGQQTKFLSSQADIAFTGGGKGGRKYFGLTLESTRNIDVFGYSGIIFRRQTTDIRDGGLWDEARPIFTAMGC